MEDEALIEAVRKRPNLYDASSLSYRNVNKKESNWREVADEVGQSVSECKKRWASLRNRHRRMRRDLKDGQHSGSAAGGKASHQFLQLMNFLEKFSKPRHTTCNMSEETSEVSSDEDGITQRLAPFDEEGEKVESPVDNHSGANDSVVERAPESVTNMKATAKMGGTKRKRQHPDPVGTAITKYLDAKRHGKQPAACAHEKDEDESFMLSFVPALKRLSSQKRAVAKVRIAALMCELEFGGNRSQLQQTCNSSGPNNFHCATDTSAVSHHPESSSYSGSVLSNQQSLAPAPAADMFHHNGSSVYTLWNMG